MEIKDINDYLGIEAESMDDFKSKFSEKYFTESQVFEDPKKLAKFTGKTIGRIEDGLLAMGKGHGLDISEEDVKGKRLEDAFETILNKKEDLHNSLIDEMRQKAVQGADEKFKTLQEEYDKALGKVKDYEGMNKELSAKIEDTEKEWSGKFKSFKRQHLENELFSGIDYAPDVDKYRKKGFEAEVREKLRFDYDENDAPYVTDSEGQRIQNPKKHGTFKSPQEVLKEMAQEAGLMNVAPNGGKPVQRPAQQQTQVQPQQQGQYQMTEKPKRRLNPKAMV